MEVLVLLVWGRSFLRFLPSNFSPATAKVSGQCLQRCRLPFV
jgi:hypothetical protein